MFLGIVAFLTMQTTYISLSNKTERRFRKIFQFKSEAGDPYSIKKWLTYLISIIWSDEPSYFTHCGVHITRTIVRRYIQHITKHFNSHFVTSFFFEILFHHTNIVANPQAEMLRMEGEFFCMDIMLLPGSEGQYQYWTHQGEWKPLDLTSLTYVTSKRVSDVSGVSSDIW